MPGWMYTYSHYVRSVIREARRACEGSDLCLLGHGRTFPRTVRDPLSYFQNSLDIEKALSYAASYGGGGGGGASGRHHHQIVQVRDGRIKIMAYVSIVVLTLLLLVIVVVVLTMFFHSKPFAAVGSADGEAASDRTF